MQNTAQPLSSAVRQTSVIADGHLDWHISHQSSLQTLHVTDCGVQRTDRPCSVTDTSSVTRQCHVSNSRQSTLRRTLRKTRVAGRRAVTTHYAVHCSQRVLCKRCLVSQSTISCLNCLCVRDTATSLLTGVFIRQHLRSQSCQSTEWSPAGASRPRSRVRVSSSIQILSTSR